MWITCSDGTFVDVFICDGEAMMEWRQMFLNYTCFLYLFGSNT